MVVYLPPFTYPFIVAVFFFTEARRIMVGRELRHTIGRVNEGLKQMEGALEEAHDDFKRIVDSGEHGHEFAHWSPETPCKQCSQHQ